MKYVLKPLGGLCSTERGHASLQLPRQRQAAPGAGQVASWPLGKVLTSLAAREKAVRILASGTRGGNDVMQSWQTEAGRSSRPGPGRHPYMAPQTDVADSWSCFQSWKGTLWWQPEPFGYNRLETQKRLPFCLSLWIFQKYQDLKI